LEGGEKICGKPFSHLAKFSRKIEKTSLQQKSEIEKDEEILKTMSLW